MRKQQQVIGGGWLLILLCACQPGLTASQEVGPTLSAMQETAAVSTQMAGSLRGSVIIEDGACCIGAIAGETINLRANQEGCSDYGAVVEMRLRGHGYCLPEGDLRQQSWEPFAGERIFPVQTAINWMGFYVSFQFRDALGNISPVYCDDIAIEGQLAPP